jgi:pimeloyl-ACP methyl ester carboxylesterase
MHPAAHLNQIHHTVPTTDGESLTLVECSVDDGQTIDDGPVFLLIHGFTGDRNVFTRGPLPAALSRLGARVYVGELRGRAQDSKGSAPGSIDAYLSLDCEAFLRFLTHRAGPQGIHFVGHSLGGLLGCCLLNHRNIASLTTIGTPLSLPRFAAPLRRLAPIASALLQALPGSSQLPWNRLLNAIAPSLCASDGSWPTRRLQQWAGLANPQRADPDALKHILENAHAESLALFLELIEMLSSGDLQIRGAVPLEVIRSSSLPVAAVVGTWDSLAPPCSVADLKRGNHEGPRRVIAVQASGHFDLPLGHHMPTTIEQLWEFLCHSHPEDMRATRRSTHCQL